MGQQQQQESKAILLNQRLKADVSLKRSGVSLHSQRSIRYRNDIRKNVPKRVAAKRERERTRAAAHDAKLAADSAAVRLYADQGQHEQMERYVVTLAVVVESDHIKCTVTSMAGDIVMADSLPLDYAYVSLLCLEW